MFRGNRTIFCRDIANSRFDLDLLFPKTHSTFYIKKKIRREFLQNLISWRAWQGGYLLSFVAIGWANISWGQGKICPTSVAWWLSWGQGKICPASRAWWPWPKVTEMGTKNFPTLIGQPCVVWKNQLQRFSRQVEKCWQNDAAHFKMI